jgi:lipopolysaccharide export system protein LptA
MRNAQAARYARWAAAAAVLLTLIVGGVYARRAWREAVVRRQAPPAVPPAVEKQSAEFAFSQVEQNRTLFTVRASHTTEFKDQDKNLLEDVQVTIFGRDGSRHDSLHTRECTYEPASGHIVCLGAVEIDLESADDARQHPGARAAHISTSDITFDRETGEVSTAQPVAFRFPEGEGRGVGVLYHTGEATVELQHSVELSLIAPNQPAPVLISGSRLEFRHNQSALRLRGPVRAQQGERELTAGELVIELDASLRASHVVASGNPQLRLGPPSSQAIEAERFEALVNPAGWITGLVAEGSVHATQTTPSGQDDFRAQRAEFAMEAVGNAPREMTATGGVTAHSIAQGQARQLETSALRLQFGPGGAGEPRRIVSGETLAPGTLEISARGDLTRIRANRFVGQFDEHGKLQVLYGHSGVEVHRQLGADPPQVITSQEMTTTFAPDGAWLTIGESGNVRFRQGDRTAEAGRAVISRDTNVLSLDGSPVVADAASRTAASRFEINQGTGDLRASGGVRTSYLSAGGGGPANLGAGPVHISAASLEGNTRSAHLVYSGGARLWQGDSVIQGDILELWRDAKHLEARGNVEALVPQAPGPRPNPSGGPIVWRVRAPLLDYWDQEGRVHLEGGVSAESREGDLFSRALDMFLSDAAPGTGARRQVTRAVALGGVVVRQGDRRGTAERADYTAADGKIVLSGGQPALADASRDITTGHSLTFFIASDTILVDSGSDSRTLTKHRVEK